MTGLMTVLGAASGLLFLAAVAGGGFALLRLNAVTGLREWLWALGAVGLSLTLYVGTTVLAIYSDTRPTPWEHSERLQSLMADLGTIAQAAIFLAVARALVVMAKREAEKPEP